MVLDAASEATLLAGVLNARRAGGSNVVALTLLGGGGIGNALGWIHDAIKRAVQRVAGFDLDVRLVSYGTPSPDLQRLVKELM